MSRNLLICCDKANMEKFKRKVKLGLGNSVNLVNDVRMADLVYVIGAVSPAMQQQIADYQAKGIKTVHVNEQLVNEEVYNAIHAGLARTREKER